METCPSRRAFSSRRVEARNPHARENRGPAWEGLLLALSGRSWVVARYGSAYLHRGIPGVLETAFPGSPTVQRFNEAVRPLERFLNRDDIQAGLGFVDPAELIPPTPLKGLQAVADSMTDAIAGSPRFVRQMKRAMQAQGLLAPDQEP
jgi:hypothetical protein